MAICPKHGPFDGHANGCPKCATEIICPEVYPIAAPLASPIPSQSEIPTISAEDKLTLKTMEADTLNARIVVSNASIGFQQAQEQLNNFAQALFEKHGVDEKMYTLDLKTLKFVARK